MRLDNIIISNCQSTIASFSGDPSIRSRTELRKSEPLGRFVCLSMRRLQRLLSHWRTNGSWPPQAHHDETRWHERGRHDIQLEAELHIVLPLRCALPRGVPVTYILQDLGAKAVEMGYADPNDNTKFSKSFWWSTRTFGRTNERLVTARYYCSFALDPKKGAAFHCKTRASEYMSDQN